MFEDAIEYELIRILGNDLPPRHAKGQTLQNLRFILENEYEFEDCRKVFILNRIVDEEYLAEIKRTLEFHDCFYAEIPFDKDEYKAAIDPAMYLTNVNQSRNLFLVNPPGNSVILPLDGNCFFRLDGWLRFVNGLEYDRGYAAIQMVRCVDRHPDPLASTPPIWYENWRFRNKIVTAPTEPQIAFLPGFDKKYDESLMYSEASKLGLLYSIGYRGVWDNWYPEVRARCLLNRSKYYRRTCEGGWCFRLPSGVPEAESNNQIRGALRKKGIEGLIKYADSKC